MAMLQYLVLVGALVNLLGTISYIKNTLYGRTKPNRVTWLMWAIAPMIAVAASISEGVTWAVVPVFMAAFSPFLVFLASFVNKKAYWKLEKFDYLCGLFSLLALILWGITKEAYIAIIFAIVSDTFAAVPTLIKSWQHPETESGLAYSTAVFGSLTGFAAINTWVFLEYAFIVYLVLMNGILSILIYRPNLFRKSGLKYD